MNEFKTVSAVSTRLGFWMDHETNRGNKHRSRRKAHRALNGKTFKEVFEETREKGRQTIKIKEGTQ